MRNETTESTVGSLQVGLQGKISSARRELFRNDDKLNTALCLFDMQELKQFTTE